LPSRVPAVDHPHEYVGAAGVRCDRVPHRQHLTGSTQFQVPIGTISPALVTITASLIILVVIFQKRIVAGLTAGAVKG
jgi:hypothetical protein